MTDIDAVLARMAVEPVPAGLAAIDSVVLARIAAGPATTVGTGIGLLAILIAAGLGLAGAGVPSAPAQAALPFGIGGAPAPSTLLR